MMKMTLVQYSISILSTDLTFLEDFLFFMKEQYNVIKSYKECHQGEQVIHKAQIDCSKEKEAPSPASIQKVGTHENLIHLNVIILR
jgi:hypothetical protein